MFSFFSKKEFLVDYLDGFVDIHNHILPGIDDGAKNVEESIALLTAFAEFGVRDFICTPHIMENYYPNTPETINKSLAVLENGLKMNNLNEFNIRVAAEHMIDSNFETILEENKIMPLANNYLLIEMSYIQASINFDHEISRIKAAGYFPILAHPERYLYLHNKKRTYKKHKEMGLMFQLNILSLSDYYGKDTHKVALQLLNENLIDFIGSDVHRFKHLENIKEITIDKDLMTKLLPIIERTTNNFRTF